MPSHRVLALGFALALSGAPAMAAPSTPIVYDGGGFITAVTSGCPASLNYVPGLSFSVHYRPYLASGDAADGLLFDFTAGAILLTPNSGTTLNGAVAFTSTGLSDRAILYGNQGQGTSKLFFSPATITASTLNVTVAGSITNIYGVPACKITIRGAMTQRP